ncbi:MAG: histidinol dehydrogenase, partial [Candidatus Altiarchaeota archaeon]|nr:histidinol dehydrogenase [Candidatus Altiarchaeota archaeon]
YGTKSIKQVNKIVGPGNKYVTAAKMLVYGLVDIDMPAGPSEILIIADKDANPYFISSDILAQSEHDPNAQSVLVSNDKKILSKVKSIVDVKARTSQRRDVLEESLENIHLVKTRSMTESIKYANLYAPEHLELHVRNTDKIAEKIVNAGAIFLGEYSPVAAGDYASGANHVLPTGGAARFSSQLSVRDFLKTSSTQKISRKGLSNLSKTIISLAEVEGLVEHANSIRERTKNG